MRLEAAHDTRTEDKAAFSAHTHRPIPTAIAGALWLAGIICLVLWSLFAFQTFTLGVFLVALSIVPLIILSRTYTTRLQDRIILLEMKLRCAAVLPPGDAMKLAALTPKQVAALRFASDRELGALLDRAVRERLSPDDMKRAITDWQADDLRT